MIKFEENRTITQQMVLKAHSGVSMTGAPLLRDITPSDLVAVFKQNPDVWDQVRDEMEMVDRDPRPRG